jgi:hypothetical protein
MTHVTANRQEYHPVTGESRESTGTPSTACERPIVIPSYRDAGHVTIGESVRNLLDLLTTPRLRAALELRYGLDDQEPLDQREVAKRFGVSATRVAQILSTARYHLFSEGGRASQNGREDPLSSASRLVGAQIRQLGGACTRDELASALRASDTLGPVSPEGLIDFLLDMKLRTFSEASVWGVKLLTTASRAEADDIVWALARALDKAQTFVALDEFVATALRHAPGFDSDLAKGLLRARFPGANPLVLSPLNRKALDPRVAAVFVVLRSDGQPMHYSLVGRILRSAYPGLAGGSDQWIHAALRKHNCLFELRGRGMFALKGLPADEGPGQIRPPTANVADGRHRTGVGDEIARILTQAGRPIPESEIIATVLQKWSVREKTVKTAIRYDRQRRFGRNGDLVGLQAWPERDATSRAGSDGEVDRGCITQRADG